MLDYEIGLFTSPEITRLIV